jgi:hypothetical protein
MMARPNVIALAPASAFALTVLEGRGAVQAARLHRAVDGLGRRVEP